MQQSNIFAIHSEARIEYNFENSINQTKKILVPEWSLTFKNAKFHSVVMNADSQPVTKMGLSVHPINELAREAVIRLKSLASDRGIEIIELGTESHAPVDISCEIVASIGGDGTLLSAVRTAYPCDIPVWGINVGDLGYLTISSVEEMGRSLDLLSKGKYWIENRTMIEATVSDEDGKDIRLTAFNDIVVHRHVPKGGMIVLDVELDGRFLGSYEADGLIFSTPTGSTGYNLSAGGSILSPNLPAFIITPICAHSFSARSLVVDDSSVLLVKPKIKAPGDVVLITSDGQEIAQLDKCSLRSGTDDSVGSEVEIRRADRRVGLVRFNEVFFFDVMRDKLGWADGHPKHRNR